jgi:phospholipase C
MARKRMWFALAVTAAAVAAFAATARTARSEARGDTVTPIQHLVVIFGENISFDHYFGTYPTATNSDGQTFHALPGTPTVDGLSGTLLTANPNGANPQRLDSSVAGQLTCDQDHNYTDEQTAFDGGKMDQFISSVGTGSGTSPLGTPCVKSQVMDYYDGNSVTALWNYAQHFAMSARTRI